MPTQIITSQAVLRHIHRAATSSEQLPAVDTSEFVDIYKAELVVNYSEKLPGIYLRAGAGPLEQPSDKIVRVGNVIVSEAQPYANNPEVLLTGLIWYNLNDEELYVHQGEGWVQVSSSAATQSIKGLARQATNAEVLAGSNNDAFITAKQLNTWREFYGLAARKRGGAVAYVSNVNGDDSLDNDGSDPNYPFLTVNRALLEAYRRNLSSVVINGGSYTIDNVRGATSLNNLTPPQFTNEQGEATGPVNGLKLEGTVAVDAAALTFTFSGEYVFSQGQQVFFVKDGELKGHALVGLESGGYKANHLVGGWESGCEVMIADLAALNAASGGLIIPKAITLSCQGAVTLRPSFISEGGSAERAAMFKVVRGCRLNDFAFKDSLTPGSHFWYSPVVNASLEDLLTVDYSYQNKANKVLGVNYLLAVESPDTLQTPYLWLDSCALASDYGACLLTLSQGFDLKDKDVYLEDVVVVSRQADPNAYDANQQLLISATHWLVNIISGNYTVLFNGGYSRYLPAVVVNATNETTVNLGSHVVL